MRVKQEGKNFVGTSTAAIKLEGKYADPIVTVSESSGVITSLVPGKYEVRCSKLTPNIVIEVAETEMVVLDAWMGSTGFQLKRLADAASGYDSSGWSTAIELKVRANAVATTEQAKFTSATDKITTTVATPKNYEYKLSTDTTWTEMKETQTVESGGTYQIRLKGVDGTSFASPSFNLVVAGGKQPKPELKIDYANETFTGLVAGATYELRNDKNTEIKEFTVIAGATTYKIDPLWMTGAKFTLVHKGKDGVADSDKSVAVIIPTTPPVPTVTISGDGKSFTGTTALMQYSVDNGSTWKDCTANMAIPTADVGRTFLFRVESVVGASFAGKTQSLLATGKYLAPTLAINYADETLTGLVGGATYELYNAAGTIVKTFALAVGVTTYKIDPLWMTGTNFTLARKGTNGFTDSDKSVAVKIPSRLSAPTGVTAGAANSNKLLGTLATQEYSYFASGPWTSCTAGETTVAGAGIYYVRTKATGTDFAGTPTTMMELKGIYAIPTFTVSERDGVIRGLAPGRYEVHYNPNVVVVITGTEMVVEYAWMGSTVFQLKRLAAEASGYDSSGWSAPITLKERDKKDVTLEEQKQFTSTTNTIKMTPNTDTAKVASARAIASNYEYKLSTATTWTIMAADTQTVASGGTYQIRFRGTAGTNFATNPFNLAVAGTSSGGGGGGGSADTASTTKSPNTAAFRGE